MELITLNQLEALKIANSVMTFSAFLVLLYLLEDRDEEKQEARLNERGEVFPPQLHEDHEAAA